jgi:hypothetical protein
MVVLEPGKRQHTPGDREEEQRRRYGNQQHA